MPSSDNKMELLAPAGSFDALKYAVYNGADAVYFGYKAFNARINAENIVDMAKAIGFCHLFNVKAYLTLNISLKDEEIKEAKAIIVEADKSKIDAFILTDISLLPIIKQLAPNAQVHASTQMGIHNRYGAMLLEKMGFDRIILSREVTFEDIKDIKKHTSIDLEIFAHGAICIGFSGSCLLSSMLTGNSGNRGKCLQLCRQNYDAYIDNKKVCSGYLLSSKDLCLVDKLQQLKEIGISSIKIEGRLKRNEYVAGVVKEYRKALNYGFNEDYTTLKRLFNRGEFTSGYGFEDKIVYPYAPNHIGIVVGEVINKTANYLVIGMQNTIQNDDGFKILSNKREKGGFNGKGATEITSFRYKDDSIQKYKHIYKLKNTMKADIGDSIAITSDSKLNRGLISIIKRLNVDFDITIMPQQKVKVIAYHNEHKIVYYGKKPENAKNQPLSHNTIKEQFSKLGNTEFALNTIQINSNAAFLTIAELNQIKRDVIELLKGKILSSYKRNKSKPYNDILNQYYENNQIAKADFSKRVYVEIKNINQYTKLIKNKIKNIVYAPNNLNYNDALDFYNYVKEEGKDVFFKPPVFCSITTLKSIKKASILFDGLICNNYYAIMLSMEYNKKIILGYNLNITNTNNPLIRICYDYIISNELNNQEIKDFDGILYSYGHLPLMYLLQCPNKTIGYNCIKCKGNLVFKDKRGYYIIDTSKIDGKNCLHTLKNGIITDIGSYFAKDFGIYLDFAEIENAQQIDCVINDYINKRREPTGKYTLNHMKRGVK